MDIFRSIKESSAKSSRALAALKVWTWLVCIFFLLLAGALFFSSWLFLDITESLDAPALPNFESNASHIRAIDAAVTQAEKAVDERTKL